MSTATSIIGTWTGYVAWGCSGPPIHDTSTVWTFKADGTWSYEFGGGHWVQVEGLVFWNFTNAAGLVYTANVTRNALDGIMGYAVSGSSPGSGCFYAVRQEAAAKALGLPKGHDLSKGPHKQ
jgi:hypothetical protein